MVRYNYYELRFLEQITGGIFEIGCEQDQKVFLEFLNSSIWTFPSECEEIFRYLCAIQTYRQ